MADHGGGGDDSTIVLERFQTLQLRLNTSKGRGVFATAPIPSGTTIDVSPVLVLPRAENASHVEKTVLYHYTYNWPTVATQAVVFGLGSLFNHSSRNQNVGWRRDLRRLVIVYTALRDIRVGEELCISYGANLTFADADDDGGGGEGEGEGRGEVDDDVLALGRIEVD
ncbi:protein methyltransferase [Dissoconium aciculare CBS 342.82]|uniref:Protein methyltransferase n=1 Tax=Dissoconium aciculare CBS 342.82 TaxID=1314786 RepID=A0A6J3LY52_9PEZI|nr:protein methyltransferase [Dissoconium aciculare CBS 342.82]KAF1820219.1 protein methyltransferase [Dissoconium aciculare CBS 342.82]